MDRLRRLAIDLFLMVAIGLFLGFLAPFGSAAIPTGPRLFFWVGFIVAGYFIFRPVAAVSRWMSEETRVPPWLATLLTVAVASLPLAALVAFALGGMRISPTWFGNRFGILYLQVAGIGAAIRLTMLFVFREGRTATSAASSQATEAQATAEVSAAQSSAAEADAAPFMARLPRHLRSDLLCLEMQDHYVRVQTTAGSTLLLMRFRDAVTEIGETGMQVHRSWWASFAAMDALEWEGRSARLRLRDGQTLPVSRAWLPAVRHALSGRRLGGFDSGSATSKSAAEVGHSGHGTMPGTSP